MVTTTSAVPLHPPSLAHPLVLSSLTISSPPHVAPSPLATLPISPAQIGSVMICASHTISLTDAIADIIVRIRGWLREWKRVQSGKVDNIILFHSEVTGHWEKTTQLLEKFLQTLILST
ncbi:hypothetical protein KIN20_029296 [Parelaphostrongylus tenuis]|uniref:Uncharacterized protein n=1 Tax=Parelaphostrongylus tenuis TaxID=148309 RepID=A0AAD5R2G7_PARTN|nr:hypothetical protein KIN20_029296 [Parelaphostrongylus tenuis]